MVMANTGKGGLILESVGMVFSDQAAPSCSCGWSSEESSGLEEPWGLGPEHIIKG